MDKYPRLCISAGHGDGSRGKGSDPGASVKGAKSTEDDVVLAVSKKLYADFRKLFSGRGGFVMLRDGGYFAAADDDAAKAGCDMFIEFHLNAGGGTGTEVLYNDSADSAFAAGMSVLIASALNVKNRGAKRRTDLAVLKPKRHMSQLLVELFFADNARDIKQYGLNHPKMELAIVNRILKQYGWKQVKTLPRKWSKVQNAAYKPYKR